MYSLFDDIDDVDDIDDIDVNLFDDMDGYEIVDSPSIYKSYDTFTHVRKATGPDGSELAVKIYRTDSITNRINSQIERDILLDIEHPNIVKLVHSFTDSKAARTYLFMPLYPLTLHEFINDLTAPIAPESALDLFKQLGSAVHYLHTVKNIAHSDIKAENCLMDHNRSTVVLCDFQFARVVPTNNPKTSIKRGTPLYASPELMYKKLHNPCENDVWSLGVLFYVILHKKCPFDNQEDDILKLARSIKNDHHNFTYFSANEDLDLLFEKLLDGMLAKDPRHRLNISEVVNLINF